MAAASSSGPDPDLYQVLGVSREASSGEIRRAWRRRAIAEHPDRKPRDAAAPARFGALAEAYRVLGDPARRAAYDRSLAGRQAARPQGPAAEAPARRPRGGFGAPVTVRPARRPAEPLLRAGPVWVDIPPPPAGPRTAEDDMPWPAELEGLAMRYLAGERGWRW